MNPYLSIVMGIGGNVTKDLLVRLRNSLSLLSHYARAHDLSAEIIIVEWNTKPLGIRVDDPTIPIRIIHAPKELHAKLPNPHGFGYFEFFPKNIGIRRARGEFVLSTNPDDLWSDDLAAFFGRRELKHGHFYRVNRHDTRDGQVFRICYPTGGKGPNDTIQQIRTPAARACPWSPDMIHYSASGDFTLMSRDDWFMIHGNPERDYNDSVDGQTLWLAHLKGLKQIVLPYPIYHPDHDRTLNLVDGKTPFASGWDDNFPHTLQNGEGWGFADMEFAEIVL